MSVDIKSIVESLKDCPCGRRHYVDLGTIEVGQGRLRDAGAILRDAGFGKRLHLVGDENTMRAASGVTEYIRSAGFDVDEKIFPNYTCSLMDDVDDLVAMAKDFDGFVSVGTGSLNDICRMAAAKTGKKFALIATAPSMDGFASGNAPITEHGFKRTFDAKVPDVIIGDTDVLAASPAELKSAGLGDLLGKYTALADWRVASLLTGEYYCPEIEALMRRAVDAARKFATLPPNGASGERFSTPAEAESLMDALILSGVAMFLSGCTRPASGSEHHLSHFWEMSYALRGMPPVLHGRKVGVACGLVCDMYHNLAKMESITTHPHVFEEDILKGLFGPLYPELVRENTPDPVSLVDPKLLVKNWDSVRGFMDSVPTGDEVRELLRATGGAGSWQECGIPQELAHAGVRYGYYARFRITALRVCRGIVDHGEEIFPV